MTEGPGVRTPQNVEFSTVNCSVAADSEAYRRCLLIRGSWVRFPPRSPYKLLIKLRKFFSTLARASIVMVVVTTW
jgi:hypothetical protein